MAPGARVAKISLMFGFTGAVVVVVTWLVVAGVLPFVQLERRETAELASSLSDPEDDDQLPEYFTDFSSKLEVSQHSKLTLFNRK